MTSYKPNSQRYCLQIPSYWDWGFNMWFCRDINMQSIAIRKSPPGSVFSPLILSCTSTSLENYHNPRSLSLPLFSLLSFSSFGPLMTWLMTYQLAIPTLLCKPPSQKLTSCSRSGAARPLSSPRNVPRQNCALSPRHWNQPECKQSQLTTCPSCSGRFLLSLPTVGRSLTSERLFLKCHLW